MANSMPYLEIDMKTRLDDEIQKLRQQRRRLVVKKPVAGKRLFKKTDDGLVNRENA